MEALAAATFEQGYLLHERLTVHPAYLAEPWLDPRAAAEILDDEVRWVLTKGKLPTAAWIEVVQTAHRLGIPTTSTMMYGHVDQPHHWVAHLQLLARLQAESGGFTGFVPLPFVHTSAPLYLAGVARPGPTLQDNRAVHAVARLVHPSLLRCPPALQPGPATPRAPRSHAPPGTPLPPCSTWSDR